MTHRVLRTVLGGLVIATAAACSGGPGGSKPVPAWLPPSWIHGTWAATGTAGSSAKLKASTHNVVVSAAVSGVTALVDIAQIAEDGVARIEHQVGIDSVRGLRFYFIAIHASDGRAEGYIYYEIS